MREIKFRAFLPSVPSEPNHRGQMFDGYVDSSKDYTDWGATNQDLYEGWRRKEMVLMQYTGLKDKNGKEIYEGDLVKVEGAGGEPLQIVWNTTQLCGFAYQAGAFYHGFIEPDDSIEVIGNIYENPELLSTPN